MGRGLTLCINLLLAKPDDFPASDFVRFTVCDDDEGLHRHSLRSQPVSSPKKRSTVTRRERSSPNRSSALRTTERATERSGGLSERLRGLDPTNLTEPDIDSRWFTPKQWTYLFVVLDFLDARRPVSIAACCQVAHVSRQQAHVWYRDPRFHPLTSGQVRCPEASAHCGSDSRNFFADVR